MTSTVGRVRFEHHREALGIGESRPRISWTVQTDRDEWTQQAYEIQVAEPGGDTDAESTGRVASAESVLVPWPAAPMGSRARRLVRVRVWGNGDDSPSDWSEPAEVETGLLGPTDWTAQLITPSWPEDTSVDQPPALFRREFDAPGDLVSARLYVTAHGVVEVELNGSVVGDDVLAPGWSSYRHRLRYHTYDVTDLLQAGANAIGATVAEGWFRGLLGFEGGQRNIYGDQLALLAQLEIRYADGRAQTVHTDADWRAHTGPILSSGLYAGETYDARRELTGWSRPGFDDRGLVRRTRGARGDRPPGRSAGSAGAPDRGARAGRAADLPEWRADRRLRSEPRRAAADPRSPRRGRADDHPAARRGPRSGRARHPAVAARRRRPTGTSCAASPRRPGSRASPTTASATPRSPAGPAT